MSNDGTEQPPGAGVNAQADGFTISVEYPHPFAELAVQLCRDASRYICILSPHLDHAAFDNAELADALSALARSSRQTQVRILIGDAKALVGRGHRLLQLARRMPSSICIQKLSEHPDWSGETIVIKDRNGVLYKPGGSAHDGFYEPNSGASTQKHLELFNELWRHSAADTDLRSLTL